jgi:hypothetical protein
VRLAVRRGAPRPGNMAGLGGRRFPSLTSSPLSSSLSLTSAPFLIMSPKTRLIHSTHT